MVKHLTKHGNSLALVLDRRVLDLLEIDTETPLSITTDGKSLIVSPCPRCQTAKDFTGGAPRR